MQYRKLGRTGFEISVIGFGAWGIGGKQWLGGEDTASLASVRRAIELGVNFIDTALAYGDGHSETLVGQVVRECGTRIYVATKVPPKDRIWPAQSGVDISQVFPYEYIIQSAEESLRNLKLDAIDLLQLHVWNDEFVDRDEWKRAFEDLKKAGKVRSVGVSLTEHDPDSGLRLVRSGLIDAVQVIYNVFDQTPERSLFPACLEENVGVLARVPLDEGGLTGKITENSRFEEGEFRDWYFRGPERKRQVVEHVSALMKDLGEGVNLAETALRFCIQHPAVTTVIPGMRTTGHAESNAAVGSMPPLSPETMAKLRKHAWERSFYQ